MTIQRADGVEYEYKKLNEGLYQVFMIKNNQEEETTFFAQNLSYESWLLSNRATGEYLSIGIPHKRVCTEGCKFIDAYLRGGSNGKTAGMEKRQTR